MHIEFYKVKNIKSGYDVYVKLPCGHGVCNSKIIAFRFVNKRKEKNDTEVNVNVTKCYLQDVSEQVAKTMLTHLGDS